MICLYYGQSKSKNKQTEIILSSVSILEFLICCGDKNFGRTRIIPVFFFLVCIFVCVNSKISKKLNVDRYKLLVAI